MFSQVYHPSFVEGYAHSKERSSNKARELATNTIKSRLDFMIQF